MLGVTGRLTGDEVLDILLAQPATAEFIADKLWREFVSPTPDPARVGRIARRFRDSGYNIAAALREVLNQPEVVDGNEELALVKSPVELFVGLVRQTGGRIGNDTGAAAAVAAMGQNLFSAPNVRGWPGGEAWINTQTLLVRKQVIERALTSPTVAAREARALMTGMEEPTGANLRRRLEVAQLTAAYVDPAVVLKASGGLAPERALTAGEIERLSAALMAVRPVAVPADGTLAFDALRALLLDPAYQLK